MEFHRRFHFDLSDLITLIHHFKLKLPEQGIPVPNFLFSAEKGFYLPDFDYNVPNQDYQDVGIELGKERTLMHIHYALGVREKIQDLPHKASNCPMKNLF